MKIWITGANGFLGSVLREVLASHSLFVDRVELLDLAAVLQVTDSDVLIHLAGKTFVPDSFRDPHSFYKANLGMALNLAEWVRVKQPKLVINLCTYLYGTPQYLPIDEVHPLACHSPYNDSKRLAEQVFLAYPTQASTKVISLRIFNVYGPQQPAHFLIPTILDQIASGQSIKLKDLRPKRDYLFVSDLCDLLSKIVEGYAQAPAGIYNVGSGRSYSVQEVVDFALAGESLPVQDLKEYRPNEVMDCYADIAKVAQAFQWHPKVSLKEGLQRCKQISFKTK